jgi:hypothetical protein
MKLTFRKSLLSTLTALALTAPLASAQTAAPPNASFADEFAAWQRLSSSNPAYRASQPDVTQPAADPVPRPATLAERKALFNAEENAWQAESRSDTPPEPTAVQAANQRKPGREPLAQRVQEFADTERTDQQLSSSNPAYQRPTPAVSVPETGTVASPAN